MNSIFEGGRRRPEFSELTREDSMKGHCATRCFRLALILALAMALVPVAVQAQQSKYTMAACIESHNWAAPKVLEAPAALNTNRLPANLQSIQTCANFCQRGTIPPGAGEPRGYSAFRPPYRYTILDNGRWCFCGNQIQGATIERGACAGKMVCLADERAINSQCYINTVFDHMVVDLTPPAGTTTVGGGGGGTGGGGVGATASRPPPAAGNRRPNAPTVQPGGWDPPFPLQYEGAYQMTWRNNGDPDGDVLTFGLIIWQYDWTRRQWMQMPGIRDQYGTYGMVWLRDDVYTFTMANGLSPRTHYAWMVFACDLDKGDATLCSWSGWGLFRTQ
jgi:hypothetical protein